MEHLCCAIGFSVTPLLWWLVFFAFSFSTWVIHTPFLLPATPVTPIFTGMLGGRVLMGTLGCHQLCHRNKSIGHAYGSIVVWYVELYMPIRYFRMRMQWLSRDRRSTDQGKGGECGYRAFFFLSMIQAWFFISPSVLGFGGVEYDRSSLSRGCVLASWAFSILLLFCSEKITRNFLFSKPINMDMAVLIHTKFLYTSWRLG